MKMPYGQITKFANAMGCDRSMIHNYLIGHRNARPQTARRLGELTGSDPFLWMAGGSPSERQAAVNNWALHASSIADKQPAVQEQL